MENMEYAEQQLNAKIKDLEDGIKWLEINIIFCKEMSLYLLSCL